MIPPINELSFPVELPIDLAESVFDFSPDKSRSISKRVENSDNLYIKFPLELPQLDVAHEMLEKLYCVHDKMLVSKNWYKYHTPARDTLLKQIDDQVFAANNGEGRRWSSFSFIQNCTDTGFI